MKVRQRQQTSQEIRGCGAPVLGQKVRRTAEFSIGVSRISRKTGEMWGLFRLRQFCNHCGNFFEYLVPALELPAVPGALHRFISNESKLRLAVS